VELSRAIGNFSGSCDAQRWLALVHLTAGHHARAAELATSAIELAARGGTGGRRPTRTPLWRPSSWRGNPERAVGACREALRVTESSDSTDDVGPGE
jgi:hypothetical protein